MATDTRAYMVEISEQTRYKLDNLYPPSQSTLNRRASLKHYFHSNYVDARPDWLVKARSWSVAERRFKTYVMLTDKQVAQVLQLSIDMDIDPKPAVLKMTPSSRGTVRFLLGTFLEAAVNGYIVPYETKESE